MVKLPCYRNRPFPQGRVTNYGAISVTKPFDLRPIIRTILSTINTGAILNVLFAQGCRSGSTGNPHQTRPGHAAKRVSGHCSKRVPNALAKSLWPHHHQRISVFRTNIFPLISPVRRGTLATTWLFPRLRGFPPRNSDYRLALVGCKCPENPPGLDSVEPSVNPCIYMTCNDSPRENDMISRQHLPIQHALEIRHRIGK
jgi:hypothetical protein